MVKKTQSSDLQQKRKVSSETSDTDSEDEKPVVKKTRVQTENLPLPDTDANKLTNGNSVGDEASGKSEGTSPKVYNDTYAIIKAKQRASMERPKLFLSEKHFLLEEGSAEGKLQQKTSPLVYDLQSLVLFALCKGRWSMRPRCWCMKRPGKVGSVALVVLDEVSATDFQHNSDCFPFLQDTFSQDLRTRLKSPSSYFSSFDLDMYGVPQTDRRLRIIAEKNSQGYKRDGKEVIFSKPETDKDKSVYPSKNGGGEMPDKPSTTNVALAAATEGKETTSSANSAGLSTKTEAPDEPETANPATSTMNGEEGTPDVPKGFTLLNLLLSTEQLKKERYPMPGDSSPSEGFKFSKEKYTPVTEKSPLFAVDCEMCLTTAWQNELTRVSVVNQDNELLYDELVKPYNPIINYLTRYSGITKKMLDPVTKRIEEVQKEISELLPPNAILCGQSLCNDLKALKMYHPYVIDTSTIFNLSGNRNIKCGLRRLTYLYLGRTIQDSRDGHCSTEDAIAAMDLIRLKLEKGLEYGDAILGGIDNPYLPSAGQSNTTGDKPVAEGAAQTKAPQQVMLRSLFDFLHLKKVSACLIGRKELVTKYEDEPGLKCVTGDTDGKLSREARKVVEDTGFTWVQFADLLEVQDSSQEPDGPSLEEKRTVFKKLDLNLKKLVGKLPEKCLVAVVMPGRKSVEDEHLKAAMFFHIT